MKKAFLLFLGLTLAAEASGERDGHKILLNAGDVDTRDAATRSRRALSPSAAGKRLHLIQFDGPTRPDSFSALTSSVRVVTYIPNNAYLVFGTAAEIAKARAAAGARVQWDGALLDGDKLQPRLRPAEDGWLAIQLVADAELNDATLALIDALKVEPIVRDYSILKYRNLVVHAQPGAALQLMTRPDVLSIRPYVEPRKHDERQDQIIAGNVTGHEPSGPGYLAWLATKGFTQAQFTASGFVVDVTDSGIDNGTNKPNHFALYIGGNTGQASRVVYNRLEGSPHAGSTIQGCDGHGNLNAHIISGFDTNSSFPHVDSSGFRYGLGVCPFVKVGSSVIFDPDKYTGPTFPDLFARAYSNGARITSHSWGGAGNGDYDSDSQTFDALVRDAQPTGSAVVVTGNQAMVVVVAAGNDGSSASTVSSPGTAKNVITVGASENVRSFSSTNGGNNAAGTDGSGVADTGANSIDDVINFSSRGPCTDGRMKPDLCAPGTHITGGAPQDAPPPSPSGTGNDLACFDASGVSAIPPSDFFPTNQQFFTTSSGTSHSCPAVSGGAALIRQYFINLGLNAPSPAMTKALLLNSARYQTGVSGNDTLWSANQGMGGMNLGLAFDSAPRELRDELAADLFTTSGQARVFVGSVSDTTKPFRVTVAWSDAPGSTVGDAWNNDLDLTVFVDGKTYRGNVFSGAFSATGGTADAMNNCESVFLPAGVGGPFSATISAENINSDGLPGNASPLDQDFALVIYNGATSAVPLLSGSASILSSETCTPTNGAIDPGEQVNVQYSLRNVGNATATNVSATLQTGGGVSSPSGPQNFGDIAAGVTSPVRSFTFTAGGACGDTIHPTLALQSGGGDLGAWSFAHVLGAQVVPTQHAANASAIVIPSISNGLPYPATITVTGQAATIVDVSVTLSNLVHSFPDDLDILLVGPQGESVLLMSDAGGSSNIVNTTIRFDDGAAAFVPDSSVIAPGTYKPSNYGILVDGFDPPAPSGPYSNVLAVFAGTAATGTWSLYVTDDAIGDTGILAQGWALDISYAARACCESDTDGDGIADVWEQAFFGNLTNATATSDNDGDGFIDLHEFLAGTTPTNVTSLLEATSTSNTPPGAFVVKWSSESNRVYGLARATNLVEGFSGFASNLNATPPLNVFTDAAATDAVTRSYRIQIQ